MLAGASTDYYIEIERGGAQPSEQMLSALARALRLTNDERDHLYRLAGRPLPPSGGSSAHLHPAMFDLLDRLSAMPAFVCTDLHVMLVQNRLADALFGPIVPAVGPGASFIHQWFIDDPRVRALYRKTITSTTPGPSLRTFVRPLADAVAAIRRLHN